MSTNPLEPWGETNVVGQALPRIDAYERVSGSAVYAIDMKLPDMLYAAVLRCPHGHARVLRVDTSRAERMAGVRAIITDATPETKIPWYDGPKGATSRLFDPHCRYAGEEVAAVAAETLEQAIEAARAVQVEYEKLPFVVEIEEALKPGAPAVAEGGNADKGRGPWQRGDVAKGFAEADVVLEATYTTSCQLHATAEVHGSIARWDGDYLTVWDTTQGVFGIQEGLANALRMPLSSV